MPCSAGPSPGCWECGQEEIIDCLTDMLCRLCSYTGVGEGLGCDADIEHWWSEHQAQDRVRREEERIAKEKAVAKAKLDAEKKVARLEKELAKAKKALKGSK